MNQPEDQDPVWDLLKHARPGRVDPEFAQEVLREVRQLQGGAGRGRAGFGIYLRAGAAVAAAAALVLGGFFLSRDPGSTPAPEPNQSASIAEFGSQRGEISIEEFAAELDELAYLSDLMEVSDTSLLPDEDLAALLF